MVSRASFTIWLPKRPFVKIQLLCLIDILCVRLTVSIQFGGPESTGGGLRPRHTCTRVPSNFVWVLTYLAPCPRSAEARFVVCCVRAVSSLAPSAAP